MKLLTTIRTHWKKSLFGVCAGTYGTYYLIERKHNADLLQAYCFEALKYGKEKVNAAAPIKRVTIFLNPIANGERGRFLYDNNVAPLLHLSGLDVRLVRLDRNSEANEYMAALDLNDTDCIVVAGGNATLNECISGLINRPDSAEFLQRIPIGLIPIGETNTFAQKWFMQLGLKKTNEQEIRMLADSALSIIKGLTMPADLLRVTLTQEPSQPAPQTTEEDTKQEEEDLHDRGAYSLLKENKIYALSNFSAGFVTETDAQLSNYWYFWRLKGIMNRYFTDRYLRRQPIKYDFNFKIKCHGCSKCLDGTELRRKLDNFVNKKHEKEVKEEKLSFMQTFYRTFIGIGNFQVKETPQMKDARLKTIHNFEEAIKKSEIENPNCNRLFQTKLIQSQIEANINRDQILENNEPNLAPSSIDTVVVKDPKFNFDDMFLAQKRELQEFELKKSNVNEKNIKFKKPEDNMENYFCVEVDGEVYKLNNQPGHEVKIRVEHMEKAIQLLKHDPEMSKGVQVNYWPRIYMNKTHEGDMPVIRPFENFYIEFSKREDLPTIMRRWLNF